MRKLPSCCSEDPLSLDVGSVCTWHHGMRLAGKLLGNQTLPTRAGILVSILQATGD